MSYLRRDFLKATGMLGLGPFVAGYKNASIALTVIDAGVPETKGMGRISGLGAGIRTGRHRWKHHCMQGPQRAIGLGCATGFM